MRPGAWFRSADRVAVGGRRVPELLRSFESWLKYSNRRLAIKTWWNFGGPTGGAVRPTPSARPIARAAAAVARGCYRAGVEVGGVA